MCFMKKYPTFPVRMFRNPNQELPTKIFTGTWWEKNILKIIFFLRKKSGEGGKKNGGGGEGKFGGGKGWERREGKKGEEGGKEAGGGGGERKRLGEEGEKGQGVEFPPPKHIQPTEPLNRKQSAIFVPLLLQDTSMFSKWIQMDKKHETAIK